MSKNFNIIAENSTFKGNFVLSGSIKINGNFEGNIKTEESIIISITGVVKSDINAKTVLIEGELTGNITVTDSVVITSTGKVNGNITSPNLKIEDGAITYGKISINEK